jgi:hypothetical protein
LNLKLHGEECEGEERNSGNRIFRQARELSFVIREDKQKTMKREKNQPAVDYYTKAKLN